MIPPFSMTLKKIVKGGGTINKIIDTLPFELHLKSHQFCGPGTRFEERHSLGQRGINPLDNLCYYHDRTYHNTKDETERYNADKQLEWGAWELAKNKKVPISQRAAAWFVTNAMKLKTMKTPKGSGIGKKAQVNRKKVGKPRKNRKVNIKGGFLPALLAALPFFSAVGSLIGGGAAVAKTVIDAKKAKAELNEVQRHNQQMEEVARSGKGLYIKPYKQGRGLFIKPYKQGSGVCKQRKVHSKKSKN